MGLGHGKNRKGKAGKKKKRGNAGTFDVNELKSDIFYAINELRQLHQVGEIALAREIDSISQSFANKLAKKGELNYSDNKFRGEELGEILFYYSGDCDADTVIESWNKDSKTFKYNSKNPEASSFAQIVWKSSQYIGIGIAKDNKGATYIVSNFYPAGNVVGQFAENVFPPKGKAKKKEKKVKEAPQVQEQPREPRRSIRQSIRKQNLSGFSRFDVEALESHNRYRRKHHVPPLTLNKDLCKIAQGYANKLISTHSFKHSKNKYKGNDIGENLYTCKNKEATGEMATTSWYDEIKDHNFRKDFQSSTGHLTQLVWKNTQEVGFGIASKGGVYVVVANYYPPGNTLGLFHENVFKA